MVWRRDLERGLGLGVAPSRAYMQSFLTGLLLPGQNSGCLQGFQLSVGPKPLLLGHVAAERLSPPGCRAWVHRGHVDVYPLLGPSGSRSHSPSPRVCSQPPSTGLGLLLALEDAKVSQTQLLPEEAQGSTAGQMQHN